MIKVNYRALGMLSTNCYVVENPDSQKVLIVDPGDSPLEIERQIDEIDGDPELSARAKQVLVYLHDRANKDGKSCGKNTISRSMSMKKSSTCWGIQRKIFPGSGANRTRCRRTKP